jgi:hypothetical protein
MANLPENDVTVFEFFEFFELTKRSSLGDVRAALDNALVAIDSHPGSPTPIPPDVRRRALDVTAARQQLKAFLSHRAVTVELPMLENAYRSMNARRFDVALESLAGVNSHAELPDISAATAEAAYSGPISFHAFIPGPPDSEGEPTTIGVTRTILRGYEGPPIPAADLVALNSFMRAGADRKRLLESECLHGLGGAANLVRAIDGYATLLPAAITDQVDVLGVRVDLFRRYAKRYKGPQQAVALPGICATWARPQSHEITPAQQFVALRSALAHLALGDHLWRLNRVYGADRDLLGSVYVAATALVAESGISPRNALRGQIQAHAARQRAKLAAGLNALGLWDAFVPPVRYSTLKSVVTEAIEMALAYAGRAREFMDSAQERLGQILDLEGELELERESAEIYKDKVEIAWLEDKKADEQVELIKDQQKALKAQTAGGLFSLVASNAEIVIGGPPDPRTVAGITETLVNHYARDTELGHQLELAKRDADIAGVQRQIAAAEFTLSERRQEHLRQKLEFERNRRINADMLLYLAEVYEKPAARLLDAAILRAYLAERALAFAKGEEIAPVIRLDYWDNPDPDLPEPAELDPIVRLTAAVEALKRDFELLKDPVLRAEEGPDLFQEHISLREHYPLEFARLLQDGEMYFEYSMYMLSKRFPPVYKCRLYDQAVEVHSLGPEGARGVLEHAGAFLVRQKDVREATRLVPRDDELAAALARQRQEGRGVASVGGVLYYVLPPERRLSTLKSALIRAEAPADLAPPELREGLEGYAPTGLWRLELFNLPELRISDITVHLGLLAGVGDRDFESRIKQLIREYEAELALDGEQLDKITEFSLRQQFPDALADLRTGSAAVALDRDQFPDLLANLRFKALVAQALDDNDRGVEGVRLRYAKPDAGFQRERVTQRGGFSENLDADVEILAPADRFPVEGSWRVELIDPRQFARLADVRLFVMYSYELPIEQS